MIEPHPPANEHPRRASNDWVAIFNDEFFVVARNYTYPIWALLLIGLNVWVIWALTRPGAIRT